MGHFSDFTKKLCFTCNICLKLSILGNHFYCIFRVVIPLCGGNIDPTVLGRCIERGLSSEGRLIRFIVNVKDRPGGIAELAQLISSIGVR